MTSHNEDIIASINFREDSVIANKNAVFDELRIGVCGGALVGVGLTGEIIGITEGAPIPVVLGLGAIALGGLLIKSSRSDLLNKLNNVLEDQQQATEMKSFLQYGNQEP